MSSLIHPEDIPGLCGEKAFTDLLHIFLNNYSVMKTKIVLCGALLLGSIGMVGKNPIIQTHFTPDPAPSVFGDVCYLYTDRDEMNPEFFSMWEWTCYSSKDLVNSTDHPCPLARDPS